MGSARWHLPEKEEKKIQLKKRKKRKKKIMSKDVSCQLKHKDATCRSEGEIMDYGLKKKRERAREREHAHACVCFLLCLM